jgi:hypothetical protein
MGGRADKAGRKPQTILSPGESAAIANAVFSFFRNISAESRTVIVRIDFGRFQSGLTSTHERRETDDHLHADR